MRTVVYTAEIDDRFGAGKVSSRIGLSSPARLYNPQTSLYNDIAAEHKLKPIHCVLVDESQFLTREQVHELSEDAFDDQCTGANPRYPLISELKQILLDTYYGREFVEGEAAAKAEAAPVKAEKKAKKSA